MEKELKFLNLLFEKSGVKKEVLDAFKNGRVYKSVGFESSLFDLNDEEKEKVREIESSYNNTKVVHMIKGTYILGGVDEVVMDSYIIISTNEDEFPYDLKALKGGNYANAYVVNDKWGVEEIGSIVVKVNQLSGGIVRVG